MAGYFRSFDDELDWQLLSQLHNVVLQISTFCFRTKQICLIVNIAVVGILFKVTASKLDDSIFVAGLVIPAGFWFLDAIGYFYQIKMRQLMENIRAQLKERNKDKLIVGVEHDPVIAPERLKETWLGNAWSAFANHSMWLYGLLITADLALWLAYSKGWFAV